MFNNYLLFEKFISFFKRRVLMLFLLIEEIDKVKKFILKSRKVMLILLFFGGRK